MNFLKINRIFSELKFIAKERAKGLNCYFSLLKNKKYLGSN